VSRSATPLDPARGDDLSVFAAGGIARKSRKDRNCFNGVRETSPRLRLRWLAATSTITDRAGYGVLRDVCTEELFFDEEVSF